MPELTVAQRMAALKAAKSGAQSAPTTQAQPTAQPVAGKKSLAELMQEVQNARSISGAQALAAAPEPAPKQAAPLPYGSAEFEATHTELCDATRKLAQELESEQQDINYWLDRVHEQLRQQPELLHMLSDEQTRALYRGIIARSKVVIVPEKAKPASKARSAKASASIDEM
jgi:hypothetical protein